MNDNAGSVYDHRQRPRIAEICLHGRDVGGLGNVVGKRSPYHVIVPMLLNEVQKDRKTIAEDIERDVYFKPTPLSEIKGKS